MTKCDVDSCSDEGTECHGGEIYLCMGHYLAAAEAVNGHGVEVDTWLDAVNAGIPTYGPDGQMIS